MWRYRYEVVSKRSAVFGKVDWVHSAYDLPLRDGHSYQVRLNDDPQYPQVTRVLREIEKKKAVQSDPETPPQPDGNGS